MFTWLPIYKEVGQWILQYRNRQSELCDILREIGFQKNLTDEDKNGKIPLEVMDPISFFGYFQKPKNLENRKRFWSELIEREGFNSAVPSNFEGLPSAQPMNIWMFKFKKDRTPKDLDLLWDLAEQAIHGELKDDTFNAVLAKKGIGLAKLTQGLFWLNPEKYYPIDVHRWYLELDESAMEAENGAEYRSLLNSIQNKFKKPFYELSYDAWKSTQESEIEGDDEDLEDQDNFNYRLRRYDQEKLAYFFDLIKRIILTLKIKPDDKRVVLSDKPRRINFIVGQRYCINLIVEKRQSIFKFISRTKLFPDSTSFDGPTVAYYNRAEDIKSIKVHEAEIIASVEIELNRSRKSPHLDVDRPAFRELIFGITAIPSNLSSSKSGKESLNTILFGPPGTGKTYLSKRKALSIVEEKSIIEITNQYPFPEDISKQFEKHLKSGQIAFTTFHQSFAYEDFIEGIKPTLDDETTSERLIVDNPSLGKIRYEIVPGIFKKISELARSYRSAESTETAAYQGPIVDFKDKQFFKMSLGNTLLEKDIDIYNYCIANDCIALGWGSKIDFTKADTEQQILALFERNGGPRSRYEVTAVKCFRQWMRKGDIVFISEGNLLIRAIGQIESDYYFDQKAPIGPNHFRKVRWLVKDSSIPVNEIYYKQFSQQTIYQLWENEVKLDFFDKKEKTIDHRRNHVLIIDEINRGNVSSVLGELITLIEEDKREGRKEAISITLPYSKKSFSVPDNLYILGTMNTADRSIEALDAALRRRFTFEEMPPRYDLPELAGLVFKHPLKDILFKINMRLEKLLDKDHKIGHSYFMFPDSINPVNGLIDSFYKNIIPLLQEYFFGDYGKIGLVLGKGFVKQIDNKEKIFCDFNYDGTEMLLEKPVFKILDYRFPSPDIEPSMTFESALDILMQSQI